MTEANRISVPMAHYLRLSARSAALAYAEGRLDYLVTFGDSLDVLGVRALRAKLAEISGPEVPDAEPEPADPETIAAREHGEAESLTAAGRGHLVRGAL